MISVTKPSLPLLKDFIPYLEKIWENKILTNNGPFHRELEGALCDYLGVDHISLFNNATIALVTALQSYKITGEVITTPYSFVATAHSLLWNNIKPVFVDIDPNTYNIDVNIIEKSITEHTSAIMPVHCYGNPCAVEKIENIAIKYGLKVIYDAAHSFGVDYKGKSLLKHGDMSVLSFHATKVFNTFEGGAIISKDLETKKRVDSLKNFGFSNEITVTDIGINGKMSEINAAFGVLQLKNIKEEIERRLILTNRYDDALSKVKGIHICMRSSESTTNGSYYPIQITLKYPLSRDELYNHLKMNEVFGRRYFYPLISNFPMYSNLPSAAKDNLPEANRISNEILCLPLYASLTYEEQDKVIKLIANC